MRIVHVSDCYPPRLGGIETQVRALAVRQAEAGHDVHVVTATPGERLRRGTEILDGVVVHRATASMPADLPVHPRVTSVLTKILGPGGVASGADAVHVHGGVVSPFAYPAARVARTLGLPTVVTIHGVWGGVFQPAARLGERLLHWSQWGVVLTAVSDAAADPMRAIVGPDVPVTLLPNGIDVERWQVDHVPGDPDECRIVAVMRLAPRKRSIALVQMAHTASTALPPGKRMRLTIVGDGPLARQVQRYVDRHDLHHGLLTVDLLGRITPDEVRATLAASDAFVAPAKLESFGIAALEARTAGLPVIAYASTGIRSFVEHGVEGLLAHDDGQMVGNLVKIAADADLREQIAAHNRSTPPDQGWPHILELVEQAYAQAVTQIGRP